MKKQIWIIGLFLSGAILSAFAGQPIAGTEMQAKTAQASHQGAGKVVSVNKAMLTIKLAHEAIESLGWSRMMMDFKVADAALLEGVKAGDAVTFELGEDAKTGYWQITRIMPHGTKPTGTR